MKRIVLLILVLGIALGGASVEATAPVTGSPGSPQRVMLIGDGCPTFSWGGIKGAESYELVVYRVGEDREDAEAILRQAVAGAVESWTPSLDRCLERGGQYAWSVRAVGAKDASEWSSPSLFEVAPGPSNTELEQAVVLVSRYLGQEGGGETPARPVMPERGTSRSSAAGSGSSVPGASAAPILQAAFVGGDAALQVNGASVVTTETLGLFSGYVSDAGSKEGMGAFTSSKIGTGRYSITFDFTGLEVPQDRMPMVILASPAAVGCSNDTTAQADWTSFSFSGGFVTTMVFIVETYTGGAAADCGFSFSATYASTSNSLGLSPVSNAGARGPVSEEEIVCRNSPSGIDCR